MKKPNNKLRNTYKVFGGIIGAIIGYLATPLVLGFILVDNPILFTYSPVIFLIIEIIFIIFGVKTGNYLMEMRGGKNKVNINLNKFWNMPKVITCSKRDNYILMLSVSVFSILGVVIGGYAFLFFLRRMGLFLWMFVTGDNPISITVSITSLLVLLFIVIFIITNFVRAGFKFADFVIVKDIKRLKPKGKWTPVFMIIVLLLFSRDVLPVIEENVEVSMNRLEEVIPRDQESNAVGKTVLLELPDGKPKIRVADDCSIAAYIADDGNDKEYIKFSDGRETPRYDRIDRGPMFGTNGSIVYVAKNNNKAFVVINGEEGPKFDRIDMPPHFTPLTNSVLYSGIRNRMTSLVFNSTELITYDSLRSNGRFGAFFITPNEKYIAVGARNGDNAMALIGERTDNTYVFKEVGTFAKTDGMNWIKEVTVNNDGNLFAYATLNSSQSDFSNDAYAVVNGVEQEKNVYSEIHHISIGKDNKVAIVAQKKNGKGVDIIFDDKKLGPYSSVSDLRFNSSGDEISFVSSKIVRSFHSREYFHSVAGIIGPYSRIFYPVQYSQNGHSVFLAEKDGGRYVVFDNKEYGPYDEVYNITMGPSGSIFAHLEIDTHGKDYELGNGISSSMEDYYLLIGNKRYKLIDRVDSFYELGFNSEGTEVTYCALTDNQFWRAVEPVSK